MGIVRRVSVWPRSGWPDEPWQGDLDEDAFCRSAVSVAEVYSQGLPGLELPAWRSWVQFGCGDSSADGRVHVRPRVDRMDTETETVGVALPPGVASWAPEDRARLVLEVLHAGMVRLGADRGWDAEALGRLHAATSARGLVHTEASAWKASPDRRHRARTTSRIAADGFSWARIEVADREGVVVATSVEARLVRHDELRWEGSRRVGRATDGAGLRRQPATVHLEQVEGRWRSVAVDPNPPGLPIAGAKGRPGRALPEMVATGFGIDAPEEEHPARIRAGGGGPTHGVSRSYLEAVDRRLRGFADAAGQAWWQDAGLRELDVTYYFGPAPGVWSRRSGPRLRAEIRRPPESTHGDAEQLAADDVRALVAEVRRKTGLGPHPTVEG